MQLLKEFPQHLYIIASVLIIISYWCYVSYTKLKKKEIGRLTKLKVLLDKENSLKEKLRTTNKEVNTIEKRTQLKLQRIKIEIVDIDFSLSEVFF